MNLAAPLFRDPTPEFLSQRFGLSPSEAATAAAIAGGFKDQKAIARARDLSVHTVRTHISRIFIKAGAESQTQFAVAAWRAWSTSQETAC